MEPLLAPESFAELAAEELIESVFDGNLAFDRQQFALVIYCHLWREYGDAVGEYEANVWCNYFVTFPVIDTGEK